MIAPEKVHREPPWKYLGWVITQLHVRPQKLMLRMDIQTLNDAQKLLGDLQWLRPIVGLSNNDLNSLRPLLKGTDPAARVSVSPEQRQTIEHLAQTVVERSVDRRDPSLPIDITVLLGRTQLLAALTQHKKKKGEQADIRVLEWLFTALQPRTTIQQTIDNLAELVRKGRKRVLSIAGEEPGMIYLPIKRTDLDWYIQNSTELASSRLSSGANLEVRPLASPVLKWMT